MSFERVLLAVLAAFVVLAAVGSLVAPSLFAQQAGRILATPSALTEIRAFYGGLQLGIGLFLLGCLRTPSRTSQGLLLVGLAVGGAGLARIFGMLVDAAATSHHLVNLGIEVVTVVLVAIALARIRRRPTGTSV
jgi:hypothetical protein